ncbi:hypothetical protein CHS0354_030320 [Potamilus streckersoni]|uniref:Cytochrome P450 n=1 Tax=Potamilus streckersoni TaxID=2493646 RepID=A0AAE0W729_9BIVA|nr:hypothetical protein CHS0354_030320 [Potamilus streckersoni]
MRGLNLVCCRTGRVANVAHSIRQIQSRTVGTDSVVDPRPFHEIPEEGYPLIGNLIGVMRNTKRSYLYFKEMHEKHGPIFRQKVVSIDTIFVLDPVGVEQVFRAEPKYPKRFDIDIWRQVRKEIGERDGLLTSATNRRNEPMKPTLEGSDWYSQRRKVNPVMLNTQVVYSTVNSVAEVVRDFLDYLLPLQINNHSVDINEEIFKWSVETIGKVLYDTRFGCFGVNPSVEGKDFANAVKTIFQTTEEVITFPGTVAKVLFRKTWEKHKDATAHLFKTARKYIDQTREMMKERDREAHGNISLLQRLLTRSEWEEGEIYASVTEIMAGAVDTTANTIVFAVDILSRNPDIQEKLYAELFDVIRENEPIAANFQNTPYLRGVVKETLRLYPATNILGRTLQEDTVVLGYKIPKGCIVIFPLYAIGRNEKVYKDPYHFKPERWFRDPSSKKSHDPFAFLPFGFGTRMCIGRRIAELEMHTFLALMYKRFQTQLTNDKPLELATRMVLIPNSPVQIRLIPRVS